MQGRRKIPSPLPGPDTMSFWDAARQGKLMLKGCEDCGRVFYYPRPLCPLCGSDRTEWRQSTGAGTVYACSVARRTAEPYCLAYVQLDDGPIVLSNVVGDDLDRVRIGQRVQVVFVPSQDGQPIPMFTVSPGG